MQSAIEYWLWLQAALGCGARVDELLLYFGSAESVYDAFCRREIGPMVTPAVHRSMTAVSPSQIRDIQQICRRNGWHIVTPDSGDYPVHFRSVPVRPLVLYVQGDPSVLRNEFNIAFVGTRHASRYGAEMTEDIAYCVARAGATVASGCAVGIDTASHIGALKAKGTTVGFLGTGLGVDYPRENRDVREAIARNGALVTEYPPGVQGSRSSFPIRNRLIAAFSVGVVVTEAAEKSGSLITASFAAEYGRDVFAIPGEIDNSAFSGSHSLIRDGAKPVFGAADILEEYVLRYPVDPEAMKSEGRPAKKPVPPERPGTGRGVSEKAPAAPQTSHAVSLPEHVDETGRAICRYLSQQGSADADAVATALSMPTSEVLASLTMLELSGVIEKNGMNRFSLADR